MVGRFSKVKPWSHHKEKQNEFASLHRLSGYIILGIGLVSGTTGIDAY
jgi:hypothetical protein